MYYFLLISQSYKGSLGLTMILSVGHIQGVGLGHYMLEYPIHQIHESIWGTF